MLRIAVQKKCPLPVADQFLTDCQRGSGFINPSHIVCEGDNFHGVVMTVMGHTKHGMNEHAPYTANTEIAQHA